MRSSSFSRSWWRDVLVLSLILLPIFCLFLGKRPFATPDEGRYVEIAREMLETGDYVTPRLNGLKYFEKPPLFYWLQSFSLSLFGIREWAMRLWTTFFGWAGCIVIYTFARQFFTAAVAQGSAIILGTSILYFILARLIILDMALTFWITSTICSFACAMYASSPTKRRLFFATTGAMMAGATLTKGLVGIVLPCSVLGLWTLWLRQWRWTLCCFHPLIWGCWAMLAVPWHILISMRHPEFPFFYFIHEHFLRYTTTVHGRYQGVWFFTPVTLLGFFPWSAFLPSALQCGIQSLKQILRQKHVSPSQSIRALCTLWFAWVVTFFSFSHSKLIPYILPAFPPAAILIAYAFGVMFKKTSGRFPRVATNLYRFFAFLILSLCIGYLPFDYFVFNLSVNPWMVAPVLGGFVGILSTTWIALEFSSSLRQQFYYLYLSVFACLALISYADPFFAPRPSIKPLAQTLQPLLQPQDTVATFFHYYQDLPVYLGRTVSIVAWHGELDFGAKQEPEKNVILTEQHFWVSWNSKKRVFVFLPVKLIQQFHGMPWYPVEQHQGLMLITNHPLLSFFSHSSKI